MAVIDFWKAVFAASLLIVLSGSASACPAGQEQQCGYETRTQCGYENEWVCENQWVCDPSDPTNCSWQNQCGYQNVYRCRDVQEYVCHCLPVPIPNPGGRCEVQACSECQNWQKYCGIYDTCNKRWLSGDWRGC